VLNELELTGRARTHVVQLDEPPCALHRDAVEPFLALRAAAAREAIELAPVSSFRDFDAQLEIWNKKYRGERTLYDADGNALDYAALSEPQIVDAILCWSALPGASRHHWGTEIDVVDRAAIAPDYRIKLLPEEFAPGGAFERLAAWLDANLCEFDFYRPYDAFRGGVNPEPWHISYAPLSSLALTALTPEVMARAIEDAPVLGKRLLRERLTAVHERYVVNVAQHRSPLSQVLGRS
jgi:LAS superfamily LD-carboxypeptidase LdcB